jgi:hypothetical protein
MHRVGLNQLLRLLARRWYVLVAVGLVTAAAAVTIPRAEGVYWTHATVVFLAPTGPVNDNALTPTPETLVNFAAIVERQLNGGQTTMRYGASWATQAGAGIREGATVQLINNGGQWRAAFSEPVLVIDVVDPDEQVVVDTVEATIARIRALAESTQSEARVLPTERITMLPSPETPVVSYAGGNRLRATGGVLAIGGLVATSAALVVDRLLLGRYGAGRRGAGRRGAARRGSGRRAAA